MNTEEEKQETYECPICHRINPITADRKNHCCPGDKPPIRYYVNPLGMLAEILPELAPKDTDLIRYSTYADLQLEIKHLKEKHEKEKAEAMLQLGKMDKVWGARDAAKKEVEQLKSVLRLIAGMSLDALGEMKNQNTKLPNVASEPQATGTPEMDACYNDFQGHESWEQKAARLDRKGRDLERRALAAEADAKNMGSFCDKLRTQHSQELGEYVQRCMEHGKELGELSLLNIAITTERNSLSAQLAQAKRLIRRLINHARDSKLYIKANGEAFKFLQNKTQPSPTLYCQTCGHGQEFVGCSNAKPETRLKWICPACLTESTFGPEKPETKGEV